MEPNSENQTITPAKHLMRQIQIKQNIAPAARHPKIMTQLARKS
jgi:hypothetical protein